MSGKTISIQEKLAKHNFISRGAFAAKTDVASHNLSAPVLEHHQLVQELMDNAEQSMGFLRTQDMLETSDARRAMCLAFCEHLARGYSKDAFPHMGWPSVKHYMEKYPEDFPQEMVEQAQRLHQLYWETVGNAGVNGKIQGFSAATWIMAMKNKFGWADKTDQNVNLNTSIAERMHKAEARLKNDRGRTDGGNTPVQK